MDLLTNKVALITGASRGIGRAIAEVFAQEGATLLLTSRSEETKHLADRLQKLGKPVHEICGDLTQPSFQKELMKFCRDTCDHLDVLVNNAGVLYPSVIGMIDLDKTRNMFDLNVHAMMNLTQLAVRLMAKSTQPSIINITSITGIRGVEGMAAYSASKSAVIGFTLSAAKELARRQIRVNAIAPGFIETNMTESMPIELHRKTLSNIGMGRSGTPLDVANCALFFASDQSAYVTGQVLGVDGGLIL